MKYIDSTDLYSDLVSFVSNKYQPVHRWFSLVEGYSSEFVRRIIGEQKQLPKVCCDPFGGVGTTALVCQELGIECHSIETNPFFFEVARTKLREDFNAEKFRNLISDFELYLQTCKHNQEYPELETQTLFKTRKSQKWIFNPPVANAIVDIIKRINVIQVKNPEYASLFKIALASQLVSVSNVFRNGKCLAYKQNWKESKLARKDVHNLFLNYCKEVLLIDLRTRSNLDAPVHNFLRFSNGDSRRLIKKLVDNSIDLVVTSPPYLNSRDYTDIYRLELWILGYIERFEQERMLRSSALTSHVQIKIGDSVYPKVAELNKFVSHLRQMNGSLWNKNIPNMVKGYFTDMENIFIDLHPKLKKGAKLYVNVSNSAYGGKICEVDTILAKIAEKNGYVAHEIRTARYIHSSNQQKNIQGQLRESVIVLEKNS